MIHESRYWKTPLLRAATWLERLRVEEETSERSLVRVEREVFVGFYAIRKLISTFKISKSTKQLKFDIQWSPSIRGKSIDYFNKHEIDELFDLDTVTFEQRDLEFLCNQVVHSYIFVICLSEDGSVKGFFLASDTMRYQKVFFVQLMQVIQAFRTVGRDYPSNLKLERNPQTDQWEERE